MCMWMWGVGRGGDWWFISMVGGGVVCQRYVAGAVVGGMARLMREKREVEKDSCFSPDGYTD